jgi:hypothetical protein
MGSVAIHDPEGDRLINLAAAIGETNLSAGERERLEITLDRRRRLEARAAQSSGRTDALDAQANERRFAVLETHAQWAEWMLKEVAWQVVGEVIAEAEQHTIAEAKKLHDELRGETDQKLNAQYDGFERAVTQLRDEDRRALFENLRETLGDAEARIDASLAKALEAEKERSEIELALVRDELLNVIAEKKYGVFSDEGPRFELAEKAIAGLRQRVTSLEEQNARLASVADQVANTASQVTTLEEAYRKTSKNLLIRAATASVMLKKESSRADELTAKVATLEAELERLTTALLERGVLK